MTNAKTQIPCQKIISGGQTGVDRAALDACLEQDFECGGWCPAGRRAEDGIIPKQYPLKEIPGNEYSYRTKKNIIDSDGTIIICHKPIEGGTLLTVNFANEINKPNLIIKPNSSNSSSIINEITGWLIKNSIYTLNVAGPRKSEWQEGYKISKRIISSLIYQIKKFAPEVSPRPTDHKK